MPSLLEYVPNKLESFPIVFFLLVFLSKFFVKFYFVGRPLFSLVQFTVFAKLIYASFLIKEQICFNHPQVMIKASCVCVCTVPKSCIGSLKVCVK